jgi:PPK2 family polyphosphate:nucleotide phosphotransferase
MKLSQHIAMFRVDKPKQFRLRDCDPTETCGLDIEKNEAKDQLADDVKRLADLQEKLYAHDCWSVLLIFQAMDAAGKDGVIKHVMSGVNPQGCQVHSFKAPSSEELDHDFLWRIARALPERGRIGIFNRSHYEEVLVVRVHRELLEKQKLPPRLVTDEIWQERFDDIREFERHLARNGTVILKFFLHVSKEEQRKRFLDRIEEPAKRWKFNMRDVEERQLWDKYLDAYEETIRNTSTPEAPWHVIPADRKWFTRLAVARTIVERLEFLDLKFPKIDGAALEELKKAREALLAEDNAGKKKNQR